jgi:outer membrane protein OmpA-like peptidoglycan-associated protein
MTSKILATVAVAVLAAACTTYDPYTGQPVRNNTGTGALIGAGAGAGLGAIVAGEGDDVEGALIGGAVGALAGAAVGQYMDRQQRQLNQELAGTGIEVDRRGDNIVLNMPGDITFAFDRADIQPQFQPVLDDIGRTLSEYNQTTVQVVGHADSVGSDSYNQALSERRARSVADALVQRGVGSNRIYVVGRGESQPIASNNTDEGRARNRRVEIILTPITS